MDSREYTVSQRIATTLRDAVTEGTTLHPDHDPLSTALHEGFWEGRMREKRQQTDLSYREFLVRLHDLLNVTWNDVT